jgi:hypothetical protein
MWETLRSRMKRVMDEQEMLRRELEALKWDMEQVQQQIRRAVWRRKSSSGDHDTESTGGGASSGASSANGGSTPAGGQSTTQAVDPVSAKLLARRGRRPLRNMTDEELKDEATRRVNPQDEE